MHDRLIIHTTVVQSEALLTKMSMLKSHKSQPLPLFRLLHSVAGKIVRSRSLFSKFAGTFVTKKMPFSSISRMDCLSQSLQSPVSTNLVTVCLPSRIGSGSHPRSSPWQPSSRPRYPDGRRTTTSMSHSDYCLIHSPQPPLAQSKLRFISPPTWMAMMRPFSEMMSYVESSYTIRYTS